MTVTDVTTPRIYVASLSDYNAGRLHGVWIDCDQETEDIWQQIEAMLKASREPFAEEWAIHDHEGFRPMRVEEWSMIDWLAAVGRGIGEHGSAFACYAACVLDHYNDPAQRIEELDRFEDRYIGHYESRISWAEQWVEDVYNLEAKLDAGEWAGLRPYLTFDYEAFARDSEQDYEIMDDPDGGIVIFDMDA